MSTTEQEREKQVSQGLQESLNTHGYTFQHVVIRRLHELREQRKSQWVLELPELPVEVRGSGTRIDFVLQRRPTMGTGGVGASTYYMLAECKRANPALSDWCFIRAPYTFANPGEGYITLDRARLVDNKSMFVMPKEHFVGAQDHAAYHIAIEVKRNEKGDRHGSPKGVIEEAVTQILRGANGMLEFFALYPDLFASPNRSITLLPVIFTTARLWASDADLGAGDLYTGNIDISKSGFQQKPWLLYEYIMSPGLKHTQPRAEKGRWYNTLGDIIQQEYTRTIAVVNATGLESFLNWSHSLDVRD